MNGSVNRCHQRCRRRFCIAAGDIIQQASNQQFRGLDYRGWVAAPNRVVAILLQFCWVNPPLKVVEMLPPPCLKMFLIIFPIENANKLGDNCE